MYQSISYVEVILSKFAGKNIVRKNVALIKSWWFVCGVIGQGKNRDLNSKRNRCSDFFFFFFLSKFSQILSISSPDSRWTRIKPTESVTTVASQEFQNELYMFFLYHFELKGNKLNIIKCSFLLSSFVSFLFCDVTVKSLESLTENDRNINL